MASDDEFEDDDEIVDEPRKERKRDESGKMLAQLTDADLDEIVRLIEAGNRHTAVAKKFGVTSPALSMLKRRRPEFGKRMRDAEFKGEADTLAEMRAAYKNRKEQDWKGPESILRNRYGWQTPVEAEKARSLRLFGRANPAASAADAELWKAAVALTPGLAPITPAPVAPSPDAKDTPADPDAPEVTP